MALARQLQKCGSFSSSHSQSTRLRRNVWRIWSGVEQYRLYTSSLHRRQDDAVMESQRMPSHFTYTSGRFLYNEDVRQNERRKVFNVEEFKRLAAASVDRPVASIVSFDKLAEGGFNRAFSIIFEDGFKLVARIPYPATVPRGLAVASEAATLSYLRAHDIPVPEVYAYAATAQNAAQTEYIFMEHVDGTNVADVWDTMSDTDLANLVSSLVKLEAKLFALEFPASGSLYFTKDFDGERRGLPVRKTDCIGDVDYCVGPQTTQSLWYGRRSLLEVNRGPHDTTLDVLRAGPAKETAWLKAFGKPVRPLQRFKREAYDFRPQNPLDHLALLEKYMITAPHLLPSNTQLDNPTIRHPDLQPNNIFVTDKFEIKSVIDWQHCSILPLCLQNGVPNRIQNFGDEVSEKLKVPELPSGFASLSETEQSHHLGIYRRRRLHHLYVTKTEICNPVHYAAMMEMFGLFRRRLYDHASNPWEGDSSALKADLVRLMQSWSQIPHPDTGPAAPCPFTFSDEEVKETFRIDAMQQMADGYLTELQDAVGVGEDGWVGNDKYEEARLRNSHIKENMIQKAELEEEKAAFRDNWPLDDFDESEYD